MCPRIITRPVEWGEGLGRRSQRVYNRTREQHVAEAEVPRRQHYVPRLILRGFSPDGRSVSLCVLTSGKFVQIAPLGEQCYENYFYGTDGGMEAAFGEMEGAFKAAIGDLSPGHLETVSIEQLHLICRFVHYQKFRTAGAADESAEFIDGLAKRVMAKDSRVSEDMLAKVKIGPEEPQHETLYHAAEAEPLLLDLDVKFLVSDKKLGFVLSDNPVASYNQWMEHHPLFSHLAGDGGIALRGLQWFLPLSPKVCVAVFDPGAYEYGSPRRRTCGLAVRDIRLLNTLQALRARECIYFDPRLTADEEVVRLCWQRDTHATSSVSFTESEMREMPDGTRRVVLLAEFPSARLGTQLGCVRVNKDAKLFHRDGFPFAIRSPALVNLMEQWSNTLEKEPKQTADARANGATVRSSESSEPTGT